MEEKWYQRPLPKTILVTLVMFVAYMVMVYLSPLPSALSSPNISPLQIRIIEIFVELIMLAGGFVVWLYFFAQFVLPVTKREGHNTLEDRRLMYDRFIRYIAGSHGPAMFIENGNVHQSDNESLKRGPGVIWLDSASAALLRTSTAYTRVVGPGVTFTAKGEYIAGTVDLHQQTQTIGPTDADQSFASQAEGQDADEYRKIQDRRWETSALTRDGIELVASFNVGFHAGPVDNTREDFSFNKEWVERYLRELVTPDTPTDRPVWSRLPSQMAVDVWREYVRRYTFNQLFDTAPGGNRLLVDEITALVGQRLTSARVPLLDSVGRRTGEEVDSRENAMLTEMGVVVLNVMRRRLTMPDDVEQRMVSLWQSQLLRNAETERTLVDREVDQFKRMGEEDGVVDFALDASLIVGAYQEIRPIHNAFVATDLLRSMLESVNNRVPQLLSGEREMLSDLLRRLVRFREGGDGNH